MTVTVLNFKCFSLILAFTFHKHHGQLEGTQVFAGIWNISPHNSCFSRRGTQVWQCFYEWEFSLAHLQLFCIADYFM